MNRNDKNSLLHPEHAKKRENLRTIFNTILQKLQLLSSDYTNNLQILTTLCGEMLNADYTLYKRFTNCALQNICSWNAPEGFQYLEEPQNSISYDVITNYPSEFCLIKDLQNTKYAETVPVVKRIGLQTYVGHKISYDNQFRGIICNLYKENYKPSSTDRKIMEFLAALIGIEESRELANEAFIESQARNKDEALILRNEARLKSIINILQHRAETLQDFLDYALTEAIKLTESVYGYVFYYSEEKREFEVFTWSQNAYEDSTIESIQSIYPLDNTGIWGEVARQRKPILLNDFAAPHPLKKGYPPEHVKLHRFLAIPVFSDNKLVATLGVANKATDYDETDILQLTLMMETVWKVVDRRKNDDTLRKLTRAVEQSPVSIIITDTVGKIEYVNEFFTKTTGYTLSEVKGNNPGMLKSGETARETYNELWTSIKAGKTWTGEFHNRKKNGELYWEEASISPVTTSEGKITHYIAVKEDITQRKQITHELIAAKEEAVQMNLLKSTFLANMSHELRTPMVGILGFSELLPSIIDNPEAIDMARTIYSSGRRLLNTLNLILDLSRIEANKQEIKWQTIELNQFIKEMIKLFEAVALQKGISLQFMSRIQPLYMLTDKNLLEHVVNDMINNAIKYTNIGSVMVRLKIEPHDKKHYIQIKVIDTGIGIPKQQQAVIFDAFRQASEGYERTYEGTGLGLTISRRYIDLMGGKITVNSEPGLGSEFTISFPYDYFQNEEAATDAEDASFNVATGMISDNVKEQPRVLLIDDDEISHYLTSRMLEGVATVDYAANGEQGLNLIKSNSYPVVLLDINLRKDVSGMDVLKEIKKLDSYQHIPIVAVTAYSMLGDRETFLAKGCTHYLSKPFSKDELVLLVQDILQ